MNNGKPRIRKVGRWWEVQLPPGRYYDRTMFHDAWGRPLAESNPYRFSHWQSAIAFVNSIAAIYRRTPSA